MPVPSRTAELSEQAQEIDFAPRFDDFPFVNAVDDQCRELDGAIRRGDVCVFTTMCRLHREPRDDAIGLGDELVDRVRGVSPRDSTRCEPFSCRRLRCKMLRT
jgi:hypothetical protein